jgi:hypothetical protein
MSKAKRNLRAKVNRNIERKMEQAMKATPPDELYEYLMDSNIPKSEAEHFAADRIAELEAKLEKANKIRELNLRDARKLQAQLEAEKPLPDKWQMSAAIAQRAGYSGLAEGKCECADELEAALEQGDES